MAEDTPPPSKGTIVLVHGLWMTPKSWAGWKQRYEQAGYTVVVPAWPGVSDDVAGLRMDSSRLNGLRIRTVVDHLATVIDGIVDETGEQPIIMGHSFGGLMTQLLLERGYGKAGIAIDSAQSAGVPVLPLSVIRAGMPVLGKPWTINRTVLLTAKQFHYAFTNTLSMAESEKVREDLQIPAPGGRPCCSSPAPPTTSCRRGSTTRTPRRTRSGSSRTTPSGGRSPTDRSAVPPHRL
ncbi:MAG: hypothetical protein JWP56_2593, partial [Aeromicrobium sp.]|nr:hypothetical protein [Aeromicrobium sp.]